MMPACRMRHIQVVCCPGAGIIWTILRARSRHSLRSGGEDTSLPLSVKVMFIYKQIAKSDKPRRLDAYPCLKQGQCSALLGVTPGLLMQPGVQSPIKPTRGDAMRNPSKGGKSDSAVDAWAIFFLILLVVGAAVFWVSSQ